MNSQTLSQGKRAAAITASPSRKRIAIIGTGISGLAAAWLLHRHHDIVVYEQHTTPGGHSHTVDVDLVGKRFPVDTGFIVYNPVNYPNLVALFNALGVATVATEMSFSASLRDATLEYSGSGLSGLFAQPGNLLSARFLGMVADVLRFYRDAPRHLADAELLTLPLGQFLAQQGYGEAFIQDHLLPMGAAIWSSSSHQMLAFPTLAFLRFFSNHRLIRLTDRPQWRTVVGGSRQYVQKLVAGFARHIRYGDPVVKVCRAGTRPQVQTAAGHRQDFDEVVLACHADQALGLLAEPSAQERELLGAMRYQANEAVLHTDTRLLPRRRRAWASWNYVGGDDSGDGQLLCVTYLMNRLQPLPVSEPVMVTLNPCRQIDPARVIRRITYEHPIFDTRAITAQPRLWDLQGTRHTWYCGAYFGSGFHEDGLQAGLAMAEQLGGVRRPWQVAASACRVGPGAQWLAPAPVKVI